MAPCSQHKTYAPVGRSLSYPSYESYDMMQHAAQGGKCLIQQQGKLILRLASRCTSCCRCCCLPPDVAAAAYPPLRAVPGRQEPRGSDQAGGTRQRPLPRPVPGAALRAGALSASLLCLCVWEGKVEGFRRPKTQVERVSCTWCRPQSRCVSGLRVLLPYASPLRKCCSCCRPRSTCAILFRSILQLWCHAD